MKPPEQAVILCGGLGTRLRPFTDSMPKPMIPVNGRPFLEHLLKQCASQGIQRFLLLTGYLGEQIQLYFGDGRLQGWEISYSHGPVEWDTGRRLWEVRNQMESRFLLLYSDNFVQFSMDHLMALHRSEQVPLSLLLAPKTKGNIRLSSEGGSKGRIDAYDKTREGHRLDFVEVGYMIVERDRVLPLFPTLKNYPDFSFSEVLQHLANVHQLAGLVVLNPYHSISDPDRLELMRSYLQPKKILLIDRDGVINQKAPRGEYISTWKHFQWIPETREAMKELAARGFKFIVISNQAGIARGMVDSAALEQIHKNMLSELCTDGVDILEIYVCPHHWDDYCDCRKPAPGMFFRASHDHLLRMDHTIYIGDDPRDCLAAQNAGCPCILVGDNPENETDVKAQPTLKAATLLDTIPWICAQFQNWAAGTEYSASH
ncbi:MAG: HAD-IIIA family hydrolase [Deltaproteobacteria bacterium]|nr:HAD-IIIA family hydrolase [Deltaproteobacteria bacterium]